MPQPRGGIDLGGTKIEAAIFDEHHDLLGSARHPTPTSGGPAGVASAMELALRDAAAVAGVEPGELAGVGAGSPGTVERGSVRNARNLPGWGGEFPLAQTLADALGCRVAVGNDVRVATEAEFRLGAGRPYKSLLGVFWGTGVGGGLILDGAPWRGRGGAGEIGHVVVKIDGARCTCGRRGCVEAYAGRAAMEGRARKLIDKGRKSDLFKLMREHGHTRLTSGIWAHALDRGDELAIELIDRAVAALGAGVASALNLLDVEAVIIGGGLGVRFGERCAQRIAAAMLPHVFNDAPPPPVHTAALGDLGGALGAALLVDGEQADAALPHAPPPASMRSIGPRKEPASSPSG